MVYEEDQWLVGWCEHARVGEDHVRVHAAKALAAAAQPVQPAPHSYLGIFGPTHTEAPAIVIVSEGARPPALQGEFGGRPAAPWLCACMPQALLCPITAPRVSGPGWVEWMGPGWVESRGHLLKRRLLSPPMVDMPDTAAGPLPHLPEGQVPTKRR